jgi:hypothetical protein
MHGLVSTCIFWANLTPFSLKFGRSEPGTDWAFDEDHPLDAATKAEFDYILAAVPHALLWPVIDAWLPGPANNPKFAVSGLENIVLRNLSGAPSATDTPNFNVSPNEAYLAHAEAQLKGFMRLIDKLYPKKIFGVQVNNLQTTVWAAQWRLSDLNVFNRKPVLRGAFVWACRALNIPKRRLPARAGMVPPGRVGCTGFSRAHIWNAVRGLLQHHCRGLLRRGRVPAVAL